MELERVRLDVPLINSWDLKKIEHYEYHSKDEDNNPNTLNYKNDYYWIGIGD